MNTTMHHTFASGLKLVYRHSNSAVVYIGIMTGAGTRDEDPSINGIAHYVEHCVFKGTAHRSARQLIEQIEGVGGEINAYTTKEETTFYAACPTAYTERTLRLIAEMVTEPTFPEEETLKELSVIEDEIESYNDSPSELIYDDFESLLFDGHSMALPILGTHRTLKKIQAHPDLVHQWMRSHYTPERMVVFVQGRLTWQRVLEIVGKLEIATESRVQETDKRKQIKDGQSPNREQVTGYKVREQSYRRHTHQQHVMLGAPAYPLGHDKQLTLYLLNNILGGGSLNSRLNMSLREQHGLVYTVESQYTPLSDTGYWSIYFACEAAHKDECLRLVREQLRLLRETPLSERQLRSALRQIHGQMAISAENQENNVLSMAKQTLYFGTAPDWKETYHKLETITPTQLQAVAQEMYDESRISVLTYE